MKTKTTITEITHEDIVNLLSTGIYGSQFLGVDYSTEDYRKIPNPDEYDCDSLNKACKFKTREEAETMRDKLNRIIKANGWFGLYKVTKY